eukprot:5305356-Karenia_brevis.AAC.1
MGLVSNGGAAPAGAAGASESDKALEASYVRITKDKLPVDVRKRVLSAMKEYNEALEKKIKIKSNISSYEE